MTDLQRLNADQDRIRKNLRETPKEAEVYATYLKKLNDQEKEIDALTAKQKSLMTDEFESARSTTTTSPISPSEATTGGSGGRWAAVPVCIGDHQ